MQQKRIKSSQRKKLELNYKTKENPEKANNTKYSKTISTHTRTLQKTPTIP